MAVRSVFFLFPLTLCHACWVAVGLRDESQGQANYFGFKRERRNNQRMDDDTAFFPIPTHTPPSLITDTLAFKNNSLETRRTEMMDKRSKQTGVPPKSRVDQQSYDPVEVGLLD